MNQPELRQLLDEFGVALLVAADGPDDLEEVVHDQISHRVFEADQLFLSDLDLRESQEGDAEYESEEDREADNQPITYRLGTVVQLSLERLEQFRVALQALVDHRDREGRA